MDTETEMQKTKSRVFDCHRSKEEARGSKVCNSSQKQRGSAREYEGCGSGGSTGGSCKPAGGGGRGGGDARQLRFRMYVYTSM